MKLLFFLVFGPYSDINDNITVTIDRKNDFKLTVMETCKVNQVFQNQSYHQVLIATVHFILKGSHSNI
jgi:hypothetical protein